MKISIPAERHSPEAKRDVDYADSNDTKLRLFHLPLRSLHPECNNIHMLYRIDKLDLDQKYF